MGNTGAYLKTEVFQNIEDHLLYDEKPSEFLKQLSHEPIFSKAPFDMLGKLKTTEQQREHHPEGNVWNHTLLVVDEAARRKDKSTDARVFMWAALLQDIGKPDTTRRRKGKITSYDHDIAGAKLTAKFLVACKHDERFIKEVSSLIR